ncbi:MAG: tyrosine-type recombinase/integrase, partial [Christensenellaceae bacterium]
AVSTRNHRLQCIRAFYSFVAESDPTVAIYRNEILKVKPAIVPKNKKIEYMSENAIQAVLSTPRTDNNKGIRDAFMMILLYDTGARIQEILDIRLSDIQHCNSSLILCGKGQKIRSVSLMESTMQHLRKYLNIYHLSDNISSDELLFYTIRNGIKRAMTTDNARKMVGEYGVLAKVFCPEVPDNVHPHVFRHSRAMHLYQHGMPLALISQWLGHANVETTLIYAYADTEMKRKAIEAATPSDSPLKKYTDSERYTISDDELIKKLYGIT